jgi:uncharacterized protein DUF3846
MNVVKKIYTDGRVEDVDQKMDLAQLQKFVGGYIEMVPSNVPHRALVVNEEGLLKELPHNVKATEYVKPGTLVLDFIRGNALLVKA